jgi:DNA mismatch repair protein MutL
LVSSNTVDKIEVRDNGHGINPDDFDSLGRPGHTSKLRSFEELAGLGGSTLGFRGVALASANVLADVSLTTRVSTEQVAAVLSLANQGGVGTQGHACAPVGTTVRITGLFSRLPVRSQVAVKEAPKSLAKMKELMQTHALTRPWIRLRFTVLKAPNLSWSYAPAPNSGVREAAMQLFGTELASQCVLETFPSESHRPEPSNFLTTLDSSHDQATGLVFEALLPIPGADTLRITKGAFFSVDSRPVSATRGTAKKLLSIFKRHLGDHFVRCRSGEIPKDPFIWLNVRCPPGSYDVNVEPSKEDVLFKEEHLILDQFESFLSSIYPTSDRRESPQPLSVDAAITDGEKPSGTHLEVFQRLSSQVRPQYTSDCSC